MTTDDAPPLAETHVSTADAAEIFGVTTYTIRRWIRQDVFKEVVKFDGYHMIPRSEVTRVAQERFGSDDQPIVGL